MDILCNMCSQKDKCVKLCQPALKYINQEYVPQREAPISSVVYNNYEYEQLLNKATVFNSISYDYYQWLEIKNILNLTENQANILFLYMCEGWSAARIAKNKNVTRQAISKTLVKIANKLDKVIVLV
jgi:hypothetical protein